MIGLQFNIRTLWQNKTNPEAPPRARDDLQQMCEYWPLNLDKEPPMFKARLDFLEWPDLDLSLRLENRCAG